MAADSKLFFSIWTVWILTTEGEGVLRNSWARIGEFHHYLEREEQGQQDYLLSYTHSIK